MKAEYIRLEQVQLDEVPIIYAVETTKPRGVSLTLTLDVAREVVQKLTDALVLAKQLEP